VDAGYLFILQTAIAHGTNYSAKSKNMFPFFLKYLSLSVVGKNVVAIYLRGEGN